MSGYCDKLLACCRAKPESVAPSLTAEEDEQNQTLVHQIAQVQAAADVLGQAPTNPQMHTAMQNGTNALQSQSEVIIPELHRQAVPQTFMSTASRPVVETSQPSFPAPP